MTNENISPLDFAKRIINATQINDIVAKHELKTMFKQLTGQLSGITTVFTHMSKFILAGYLQATDTPGVYRVLKHIPEDFTYGDLDKEYNVNRSFVKDIVEATEVQVGGDHYLKLPYQPIRLICELDMSFIQGCIIKYIARHANKNKAQDVAKAKHYAELALTYNHQKLMRISASKELFAFCLENKLGGIETALVRLTAENNYREIIVLCDRLINDYTQV